MKHHYTALTGSLHHRLHCCGYRHGGHEADASCKSPKALGLTTQVCRAAGYFEHALFVAQAAQQPQMYLDILLEDCQSYDEALAYLQDLPRQEAAAALQKYGKVRASRHIALYSILPVALSLGCWSACLLLYRLGFVKFACFLLHWSFSTCPCCRRF